MVFFHFIDMSLVIAWVHYRNDMQKVGFQKKNILDLLGFRTEVATALCLLEKNPIIKKAGKPSSTFIDSDYNKKKKHRGPATPIPQFDVRRDRVGHCGLKTFFACKKRNIHLCLTKTRRCFIKFDHSGQTVFALSSFEWSNLRDLETLRVAPCAIV